MINDPYEAIAGFLALCLVGSWALFIWLWAWNYKPKRGVRNRPEVRRWEMLSDHWRN